MTGSIKYGMGGVYTNVSEDFQSGVLMGLSRTIKANKHDAGVVERICIASRGRNPDNPSDRTKGAPMEQRYEPKLSGCCNSLTTVQKDNMVLEKKMNQYVWGGLQEHQTPRQDGISPSLTAAMGMGGGQIPIMTDQEEEYEYRIRKLTAKECWRLMGFKDADYEAAAKVNSKTQLYKQSGNSIVENVLVAIFGQLIPGKENVYKERAGCE